MRREDWGTFHSPDGKDYRMIRGARNRTWFENEAGERVSPEHSNIFPAICWMYAETDWYDAGSPLLSVACRRQVAEKLGR